MAWMRSIGAHEAAGVLEVLVNDLDDLDHRFLLVDADADHLGLLGAGRPQHVEARAVAVIDLKAEASRVADALHILVDHRRLDALRQQDLVDDLPEAAEADHEDAAFQLTVMARQRILLRLRLALAAIAQNLLDKRRRESAPGAW